VPQKNSVARTKIYWTLWRSCASGATTHTSRPCYSNSISIEIFSDVFFWWKESLVNSIEAGYMDTYSDASFYW